MLSYIVILHQTTTVLPNDKFVLKLSYIVILHQTTTAVDVTTSDILLSYIVILHQTTTMLLIMTKHNCCLISLFYIKPQPEDLHTVLGYGCLISLFYIKPQHIVPMSLLISTLANGRVYEVADVLNIILQKY